MNRTWIAIAVMAFAAMLVSTGVLAQEPSGAKVYNDNCARCHQPRAPWEYTDRAWDIIIHHMHVRGYLTEQERKAVLQYLQDNNLRTAGVRKPSPAAGAASTDGQTLVAQSGCQGCHVVNGAGGNIGPSLDTVFARRDREYILRKLSEPTFDNPTSVMPFFQLSDEQKAAIADYLKALQR